MSSSDKTNKVGRPLKFETPQDLQDAVQDYFDNTKQSNRTLTGLCLAIGTSKQVINDYQARSEFKDIVDWAKLMIEHSYELSLRENGRSGDIFALKNFGWKDKTETEHSGQVQVSATKLTDTQLDKLTQGKIDE